jgi:hypothetical protein
MHNNKKMLNGPHEPHEPGHCNRSQMARAVWQGSVCACVVAGVHAHGPLCGAWVWSHTWATAMHSASMRPMATREGPRKAATVTSK